MKLFVWERIDQVSYNYHSGGGLVVIAETVEDARKFVNAHVAYAEVRDDEEPDFEIEVVAPEGLLGKAFVFPDAGCC